MLSYGLPFWVGRKMKASVAIEDCVSTMSAPTSTVGCTALSPLPNPGHGHGAHLGPTSPTTASDEETVLAVSSVPAGHGPSANPTAVHSVAGSWLCCMPCSWLRGHDAVRQSSLVAVTLLVTSLLVASPVLFLISGAPSSREQNPCRQMVGIEESYWKTLALGLRRRGVLKTTQKKSATGILPFGFTTNAPQPHAGCFHTVFAFGPMGYFIDDSSSLAPEDFDHSKSTPSWSVCCLGFYRLASRK